MYACAACSNVGALASATRSAKNGEGRSWMFRTRRDGKLRDMGLGGWRSVTLEKARRKAAALREAFLDGRDPLAEKRQVRQACSHACGYHHPYHQDKCDVGG